MATSAIAASSESIAGTKSRNKRGLKQAEDAGEHFERVIGFLGGSTQSDFELEQQCSRRQSTQTILTNRQSPSLARNGSSPTLNHRSTLTLSL
jgi:hypothetical protein